MGCGSSVQAIKPEPLNYRATLSQMGTASSRLSGFSPNADSPNSFCNEGGGKAGAVAAVIEINPIWECPVAEAIQLGLPTNWPLVIKAFSRTVSNRRELRELLTGFHCHPDAAERLLDTLSTSMSLTEQDIFYGETIQSMIRWARDLPTTLKSFACRPEEPRSCLLSAGSERTIIFPRQYIRCILAAAFFCLFESPRSRKFSCLNFDALYRNSEAPQERAKLLALLNYFRRVSRERPSGVVTFRRLVLASPPSVVAASGEQHSGDGRPPGDLDQSKEASLRESKDNPLICDVNVVEEGSIIDQINATRVIFGCKYVGGGVLTGGSWQEESVYASNPEMIASCLFTEVLGDNESLMISGVERFSKLKGYAFQMAFDSNFEDKTIRETDGTPTSNFVVIDAKDFRSTGRLSQFLVPNLTRELCKAKAAFQGKPEFALATGNWGCGIHLGEPRLKCVLQVLAASFAGIKDVFYFSFGDPQLSEEMRSFCQALRTHRTTCAEVWIALCKYAKLVEDVMNERDTSLSKYDQPHPPSPSPEFYSQVGCNPPTPPPDFFPFLSSALHLPTSH